MFRLASKRIRHREHTSQIRAVIYEAKQAERSPIKHTHFADLGGRVRRNTSRDTTSRKHSTWNTVCAPTRDTSDRTSHKILMVQYLCHLVMVAQETVVSGAATAVFVYTDT